MNRTDAIRKLYRAINEHAELTDAELEDAGRHGADAGWQGFTYNSDAGEFFDANHEAIFALARTDAEAMGHGSVAELVGTFGRADMTNDLSGFKTLMAWYALEEVGRAILEDRFNPEEVTA